MSLQPPWWPPAPSGYTEEELVQIAFRDEDLAKQDIEALELHALVLINEYIHVSFREWLELPYRIRKALYATAQEYHAQKQRAQAEVQRRIETQQAQENARLKFPIAPQQSFDRIFR